MPKKSEKKDEPGKKDYTMIWMIIIAITVMASLIGLWWIFKRSREVPPVGDDGAGDTSDDDLPTEVGKLTVLIKTVDKSPIGNRRGYLWIDRGISQTAIMIPPPSGIFINEIEVLFNHPNPGGAGTVTLTDWTTKQVVKTGTWDPALGLTWIWEI